MKNGVVSLAFGALIALPAPCAASSAAIEVQPTPRSVVIEGRPIAAVIVTQCNLLVAVYMVMADGRLLRFDKTSALPWDRLLAAAYSAARSERVEVSCNSEGIVGYETHPDA